MKQIRKHHLAFAFLASLVIMTGCKQSQKKSGGIIDDLSSPRGEQTMKSFNQIYHLYPSPAEMLGIIDLNDMTFNADLLNPVSRSGQYLENDSKTQVLGVYMADLAYCALFGRHEATLDYLEVVRKLADEIRIENAVSEHMIEKARQNVEYLDSLYTISNEAFMNTIAFCENNDRSNTIVLMSAGAFVESIYLAVHMVGDYSSAGSILQHLADQKYTIENFMTFAESVRKTDPGVTSTIDALNNIQQIYNGINPGTGEVTVKTDEESSGDQPKRIVIGGSEPSSGPSLTREQFMELEKAIDELRNRIVHG